MSRKRNNEQEYMAEETWEEILEEPEDFPEIAQEQAYISAAEHAVHIDKNGDPLHFVCTAMTTIELKEGEALVSDYAGFIGKVMPRWNGTEWVEIATDEEIQIVQSQYA